MRARELVHDASPERAIPREGSEGLPEGVLGPGDVLITADIAFVDGLGTSEIDERITAIEHALIEADPDATRYIESEIQPSRIE